MNKKFETSKTILILIPTYNERENIQKIYHQIRTLFPKYNILFIDDNSPDGTGGILDNLKRTDAKIQVIHRQQKRGIGSAHLQGIKWAYQHNYSLFLTMDADFTHSPKYIKQFVQYSKDYDLVIGSRYLKAYSLKDWNWYRKTLTYVGHWLTKYLLGIPYDASGAFRLYRLDKIDKRCFDLVTAKSYAFFFESLLIINLNNYIIKEFSISLPSRTYGHSKMSYSEALNSLLLLIKSFIRILVNKKQLIINPKRLNDLNVVKENTLDWDVYWSKKKES